MQGASSFNRLKPVKILLAGCSTFHSTRSIENHPRTTSWESCNLTRKSPQGRPNSQQELASSADVLPILLRNHALVVAHIVALHPENHVLGDVRGVVGHALQAREIISAFRACGAMWLCSSITLVSAL